MKKIKRRIRTCREIICKTRMHLLYPVVACLLPLFFMMNGCGFSGNSIDQPSPFIMVKGSGWEEVHTIPFDSLIVTDPFILADEVTQTYYLTGSGGRCGKV